MVPVLEAPSAAAFTHRTANLTLAEFVPPATAKKSLVAGVVYGGAWLGSLRGTAGLLGPNGWLAFEFERKTADAALAKLLGILNDRQPGWKTARTGQFPAATVTQFTHLVALLERFGEGTREDFDLPLDYSLGTPFQQTVWQTLKTIEWGETISYGDLAGLIGKSGAARAVGSANGANVLAPVVPCHRVIAADGTLGGYGGGLPLKARLLTAEGAEYRR
ncbi:MAG: methylated-DNA--[protein]-cysteine S-methyltransferase [bacterium]